MLLHSVCFNVDADLDGNLNTSPTWKHNLKNAGFFSNFFAGVKNDTKYFIRGGKIIQHGFAAPNKTFLLNDMPDG
jgi:hypothetical protein